MPISLARILVTARHAILAVMIALTLLAALLIPRVGVITDMAEFLPAGSPMREGISLMEEEFPEEVEASTTRIMTIGLPADREETIAKALTGIPGVARVRHDAEDARYRSGDKALFIVESPHSYGSEQDEAIQEAIDDELTGIDHEIRSDDPSPAAELPLWIVVVAVSLLALILFIMCASWLEPILFLATIGMAVVLNLGTNLVRGSIGDVTFTIGAILQLVLSMDYSIILMNRYRHEREEAPTNREAMIRALHGAAPSILASSMTTVVGLLMLCFMSLGIGMDLGIVLAKGVFISMLSVFTILPALILMFDRWIIASAKPYWEPGLGRLARGEHRLRWPILLVFIALFAGSALTAAGTPVAYTLATDDPIAQAFPRDNPLVLVYDNADEEAARSLAERLGADPRIRSVASHSSTIGKQRSIGDMRTALARMGEESGGTGLDLDEPTLKLVYFLAHGGRATPTMTLAEFVRFLRSDPDAASQMGASTAASLDQLTPFLNREALLVPQGAAGLAQSLRMSEEESRGVLLAHAISDPSINAEEMTLRQFVDFVSQDLAADPEYSSMATGTQIAQLGSLARFTDAGAMTTPIGYAQMAGLLGADEEPMALAYARRTAARGAYDSAQYTLAEHLAALTAAAERPEAGAEPGREDGLKRLAMIADPRAMSAPADAGALAALTGQSVEQVTAILRLRSGAAPEIPQSGGPQSGTAQSAPASAQDPQSAAPGSAGDTPAPGSLAASPQEYLDFLVAASADPSSPLAAMIPAEEKRALASLKSLIDLSVSGQKTGVRDFAALTRIDPGSLALAHALADIPAHGGSWAFTPREIVHDLAAEEQSSELDRLSTIIEDSIAGRSYTPARLASLTGMSDRDARSIALLRTAAHGDSSAWDMSARDAAAFLADSMLANPQGAARFTPRQGEQIRALRALIDSVVEQKEYPPEGLAALLTRVSGASTAPAGAERMDPERVGLAYLVHAASSWNPEGATLSIAQLVSTLSTKILDDPRFSGLITEEARAAVVGADEEIADAAVQLVGREHSRMIITTGLPAESEETDALVVELLDSCAADFASGCRLIGDSAMIHEMRGSFPREMPLISWLTAASIFGVVALTFLSLSVPALLVLLVQTGVFITITAIGWQGYSNYYLAQLMVQCILMGATIDYGILLSSQYRDARRSLGVRAALERALGRSIHTIMTSGSIMIVVTGILGFLFDNPTVGQICRTISIGALAATILILLILPGLLAALDPLVAGRGRLRAAPPA